MILTLDIETIRHPGVPAPETDEDSCPAAPHHRIVAAAGVVLQERVEEVDPPAEQPELGSHRFRWYEATCVRNFGGDTDPDERRILMHLVRAFNEEPKIVTWNGDGFDLPVIRAGLMEYGIQCPWLFSREVTYRYGDAGHEDLMDTLSSYGAAKRAKQDAWARRIGLPGKMDVDGSQVATLVEQRRFEELRAYNLQDVAQLAGIWMRREFVRGGLTLAGYRMSAASLVSLCERTPWLRAIVEHERFDRKRFLMEAGC